jgi:hypothetical protein
MTAYKHADEPHILTQFICEDPSQQSNSQHRPVLQSPTARSQ